MDTLGVPQDTIVTVGEQPMGVAYNGQFVWCAEDTGFGATRQEIYEYDPAAGVYTGNFIRNPDNSPRDMTFDGQYFWLVGYHTTNSLIYQFGTHGGTPQISVPVTQLNFGLTEIGQTKTFQINLLNTGTADLVIDDLQFSNNVFSTTVTSFPLVIPQGGSTSIGVTFTPVTYGPVSGVMNILSNDPVTPVVPVTLTGKGLYSDPTIWLSAASHNFGNVWIPEEGLANWELKIANQGIQNLEVSSFNLSEPVFWVESGSLPLLIAPDDTLSVRVWFSPLQAVTYNDVLEINSNDPAQPVVSVNLEGSGTAGPFNLGYQFWNYQIPDNPVTSFNEHRVLALKSIKDLTGDGTDDVIVASRNYWTIALNGASSGFAGEIWRFSSYVSNFSAGGIGNTNDLPPQQKALSIADDLNGDGFQDVVIGTGGGNERVYALDGINGGVIWKFGTDHPDSFGLGDMTSVYVNEDFNNDNINDVIATGSGTNNGLAGRRTVYCFNGANGQILWQYFLGCFIRMAETIGDVNGNGSTEVVAGTGDGVANAYTVVAIDPEGPTGPTLIWSFPVGSAAGGAKEVVRYDIDGETSDVIAGSYFGKVYRIDGENGTQVWLFNLGSAAITHISIIEDVDGDGLDDILVCSFDSNFYCVSGADGTVIWSIFFGNFSWSARAIPDITGDGQQDVLVASRNDNLYVLNGADGTVELQYPMNSGVLQGATLAYTLPDIDNNNSYEILAAADNGKVVALSGGTDVVVGIADTPPALPAQFSLEQNYPNPFNPETHIEFSLPQQTRVTLAVRDILGRTVATIYQNESLPAGVHRVTFDGRNLASGLYFYQIRAGELTRTRKMILLK
jgi:outer membrane protein assembly factor BamB